MLREDGHPFQRPHTGPQGGPSDRQTLAGEDALSPRELARVRHETLVLWGDDDRIFPLETGRALCRALPNARLEILPRCGHVPPTERPVSFARRVEAFLA